MAVTGGLKGATAGLLERVGPAFPKAPLVVALSGGADSAVCAWAAMALGRQIRAVTVDHGLPESAPLVAAAVRIASQLGIDHRVLPAETGDRSEGSLRSARYLALESSAAAGEILLTGHTADDHAETVLGNLIRGAGATGLSGIPVVRDRWCRPLLQVRRDETRAAASLLGLPYADDPGNQDAAIRRSRLRTEVIPYLEGLNPGFREALIRTARLAAADERSLEERSAAIPVMTASGEVRLAAASLQASGVAVASRAVRRGLRSLLHPYAGSLADVESVLRVALGGASVAPLAGGLEAAREGPWVVIHGRAPLPVPAETGLPVPGSIRFGRWVVSAEAVPVVPALPPSRWRLPLAGAGGLVVRPARRGDTIDMAAGSKSVAESLREAAVAPRLRRVWPVVEQAGRMVWVVGARHVPGAAAAPGDPAVMLRVEESG